MTRDSKETVLSRWSRRKLEAEQSPPAAEDSAPAKVGETIPEAVSTGESETRPVLTDADMPDIESLTEDSDYSGFMSAGVSDELRNLALRKLFKAPVFNIRDGLDEYDEDYTYFEKLGDIVTSDMKHQIEIQEQKLREKLAQDSETEDITDLETAAEVEEGDDPEATGESIAETESELDPQRDKS